jgi:hypothetical protein
MDSTVVFYAAGMCRDIAETRMRNKGHLQALHSAARVSNGRRSGTSAEDACQPPAHQPAHARRSLRSHAAGRCPVPIRRRYGARAVRGSTMCRSRRRPRARRRPVRPASTWSTAASGSPSPPSSAAVCNRCVEAAPVAAGQGGRPQSRMQTEPHGWIRVALHLTALVARWWPFGLPRAALLMDLHLHPPWATQCASYVQLASGSGTSDLPGPAA